MKTLLAFSIVIVFLSCSNGRESIVTVSSPTINIKITERTLRYAYTEIENISDSAVYIGTCSDNRFLSIMNRFNDISPDYIPTLDTWYRLDSGSVITDSVLIDRSGQLSIGYITAKFLDNLFFMDTVFSNTLFLDTDFVANVILSSNRQKYTAGDRIAFTVQNNGDSSVYVTSCGGVSNLEIEKLGCHQWTGYMTNFCPAIFGRVWHQIPKTIEYVDSSWAINDLGVYRFHYLIYPTLYSTRYYVAYSNTFVIE